MREGELIGVGKVARLEPAQLYEVVAGPGLAGDEPGPRQAEDDPPVVRLEPEAEECEPVELECRLLPDFTPEGVEWMLVLLQEPPGQVPQARPGVDRPP